MNKKEIRANNVEEETGDDPFSPEHVNTAQLIVQMRIYDTLMAIYNHLNPEGSTRLNDLHTNGRLLGTLPYLDLTEDD